MTTVLDIVRSMQLFLKCITSVNLDIRGNQKSWKHQKTHFREEGLRLQAELIQHSNLVTTSIMQKLERCSNFELRPLHHQPQQHMSLHRRQSSEPLQLFLTLPDY
jgi:hypothetical protein